MLILQFIFKITFQMKISCSYSCVLNSDSRNHVYILDTHGSQSHDPVKIAIDARFSFVSWRNLSKVWIAGSASGINVNAIPFVAPRDIFLFSRYFICAISLNIHISGLHRESFLALLSLAFSLSGVREMKASMSHFDANFVSDFHQSCHRST